MASFATMLQEYFEKSATVFTVIGVTLTAVLVFKVASSLMSGVTTFFLSSAFSLSINLKNVGAWAVVTGCTDGIGKAYAEQLAKRGLNIVLISRTRSKLEDMAKDIKSRFKVQTKIIAVDFTRADIYDGIRSQLEGLDIGTLVNNVGMTYETPQCFGELENRDRVVMNMINCNAASVAMMTSVVLPGMLAKKSGVIINIGSAAGTSPLALLTMYSATKSFVDFFSQALQMEYGSKGITVQSVLPFFVATKMTNMKRGNVFVPTPDYFVRSALNTVGLQSRTFGCWSHAAQNVFQNCMPGSSGLQIILGIYVWYLQKEQTAKEE